MGELMTEDVRESLRQIVRKALQRAGRPSTAKDIAAVLDPLFSHQIALVKGTDQLRAFGYRSLYQSATGAAAEGDLHHLIPLYLGGDSKLKNLLDLEKDLHDAMHDAIETIKFGADTTLAPNVVLQ